MSRAHGGTVSLCSGEKGTTFTVVFPKGSNWIGTNAAA
jgi:signal transduction histidine kinase